MAQPDRLDVEPVFSPRQREVLDLLVAGKTNAEIAEVLSISLDGAKWHLREIFNKLGVDSREEAAAYWRDYNRPAARVRRAIAAIPAAGTLRLAGASAVAVIVVAAVALAIALANRDDDVPGVTETATGVQTATAPATATPSVTDELEQIGGVAVRAGAALSDIDLPADMAIIYSTYSDHGAGGVVEVRRAYRGSQGASVDESLYAITEMGNPEETPGLVGGMQSFAADPSGTVLLASMCEGEHCSMEGDRTDAETTFIRSLDGGLSWEEIDKREGFWTFVSDVLQGGVVAWNFHTGNAALGPLFVNRAEFPVLLGEPQSPVEDFFGEPAWQRPGEARLVDAQGNVVFETRLPDTLGLDWIQVVASGDTVVMVASTSDGPVPRRWFLLLTNREGQVTDAIGVPAEFAGVSEGVWVDSKHLLVSATYDRHGCTERVSSKTPVMVDLEAGTFAAVTPLVDRCATHPGLRIDAVSFGPFARVAGSGTCLNVREQPSASAAILQCYADDVLLRAPGEATSADGIEWLAVETPDGRPGWAAAEFLTLQ